MSKHTPKPWAVVDREVLEDGSVYPKHIIGGVTELQVCLFETPLMAKAIVNDESWTHLGKSEMHEANAQLIAAAPELLEALKELLDREWQDDEDAPTLQQARANARAAIKKAEGEA